MRIHRRFNQKIKSSLILSASIVAIAGIVYIPLRQVLAGDGTGSDDGNVSGGGCTNTPGVNWYDTCYGAVWRYYPLNYSNFYNSQTDTVTIPQSGNVTGGTLSGCKDLGTTGYFRLGLAKHTGNGRSDFTSYDGYGNYDNSSQAGLIPVNRIYSPNGIYKGAGAQGWVNNVNYVSAATWDGDISWDAAYDYFIFIADNNGQVAGPNGQKLGWSDVSMFCGNDPEHPPDEPQTGTFWSKSSVSVGTQGDVSAHTETSTKDGEVKMMLSTNQASVKVTFNHYLYYGKNLYEASNRTKEAIGENTATRFGDATTKYQVIQQGNVIQGQTNFTTGGSGDKSGTNVKSTDITINLAAGETKKVCQQIKYKAKYVTMKGEPVMNDKNELQYYNFTHDTSKDKKSENSRACIEVTRPEMPGSNPDDPNNRGPSISGGPAGKVVYAGENGQMSWTASAKSYLTRRYAAHQAIAYSVDPSVPYSNGITDGNSEYKGGDVCSYYTGRGSSKRGQDCKYYINESVTNSGARYSKPVDVGKQVDVVVPEVIGQKYCNSLGYKYQYWYGVEKYRGAEDEGDDIAPKWIHESAKDYWVVFNAACRSIAKKPSAAIWNGSTLSAAGITGSLSPRYANTAMHTEVSGGGGITTFGSWTEYLNVISGEVRGVASGAALSAGSNKREVTSDSNSPLTISNSGLTPLGFSDISGSGYTFIDRLKKYFNKQIEDVDFIPDGNNTTHFYNLTSKTINSNITYHDGPYTDIYSLPQNIIFVDGDLNISSNVTRIDAWLIVNGTLNTCSSFTPYTDSNSDCKEQLTINGPVVAKSINPRRSYGSEGGSKETRATPAEIFNLRQDTFLWAYGKSGNYGVTYKEVYSRELAPRY